MAREDAILDEIDRALEEDGSRRAFRFSFKFEAWNRTSHYLFLVTKHPIGHRIIRDIMSKESSDAPQGVPNFAFRPSSSATVFTGPQLQQLPLISMPLPLQPLEILQENLLAHFAGRKLSVKQVREEFDDIDNRYIRKNYRDALLRLEALGHIEVNPRERVTRNGAPTLADWVSVTFPQRSA